MKANFLCGFFTLLTAITSLHAQGILVDYDGNKYNTIRVGDQVWMGENLRSKHAANGEQINFTCYNNLPQNCIEYGAMYSWSALKVDEDEDRFQGICPEGWHIPSDDEWTILVDELGGSDSAAFVLKKDQCLGFNVQFGGNYHTRLENFNYLGKIAYYWSSTSFSPTAAWMRMVGAININLNRSTVPMVYGLSVRCVKDDE